METGSTGKISNSNNKQEKNDKQKTKKKRKTYHKKRVIIPIITTIIFLLFGIFSMIYAYYYQSTDDAYIEGHLVSISPSVSGPVVKLYVDDNQEVKAGQLLLEIDPKDYIVKLHQAEAKLAEAKARLKVADGNIMQNQSVIDQVVQERSSSDSKLQFAKKDYDRYSKMYKIGVSSKQEYDQSSTSLTVSQSKHIENSSKVKEAQIALNVSQSEKEMTAATIAKEQAEVEQAKLNLSYTKIYAPQAGSISSRSIEVGNYVQVAQPIMSIVPDKMWVVANFKETQLANMKKGQPVSIRVDAYSRKEFKGKVDSIQRASGAKSSLFPPENAVGSYVKIVQRIPVKIVFDEDYSKFNLAPGMSVMPKVKVK